MRISRRFSVVIAGAASALMATSLLTPAAQGVDASTATSLKDFGGMRGLERACRAEGALTVVALPDDWANWGGVKRAFKKQYPFITFNDFDPESSSAQELEYLRTLKGSARQPDTVDVGTAFAVLGAAEGLFAPYKVAAFNEIPRQFRQKDGLYASNYGGVVAIGYDANKVKVPPRSLKDLENPRYRNQVALNGNPTSAGAAFNAMLAISVAYAGGPKGLNDISNGTKAVSKWKKNKTFNPIEASSATVANGQTSITLDWEYLQIGYAKASKKVNWKTVIPSDALISNYYNSAISKTAPNPACARLWHEFIYSPVAANQWMKGGARPALYNKMLKDGTIDKKAAANIAPLPRGVKVLRPTVDQQTKGRADLVRLWPRI